MRAFDVMIPRRTRACSVCEALFSPGDEVITQLRETPPGYERSDRCLGCGPLVESEWSQWRTQIPRIEEQPRQIQSGEERALALLHTQADGSERWLLALFLERIGRLHRYRRTGKGAELFEDVATGELVQVIASIDIDASAVRQLMARLQDG